MKRMPKKFIPVIIFWVLLLILSACQQKQPAAPKVDIGQAIPFESIESLDDFLYQERETVYFVIWSREDIAQVDSWISDRAKAQLNSLDYSKYAGIAVFQGRQGENGHKVVIERIGIRDNTLVLVVQFWENPPNVGSGNVMTSPYEVVQISKENLRSQPSEVELHSYTQYNNIEF